MARNRVAQARCLFFSHQPRCAVCHLGGFQPRGGIARQIGLERPRLFGRQPFGEHGKIADGAGFLQHEVAAILKPGANNPAATALVEYLKGPDAAKVIKSFGYKL